MLKTWDLAIRIVTDCRAYPVKIPLYFRNQPLKLITDPDRNVWHWEQLSSTHIINQMKHLNVSNALMYCSTLELQNRP